MRRRVLCAWRQSSNRTLKSLASNLAWANHLIQVKSVQKTYGALSDLPSTIFHALGVFSLHVNSLYPLVCSRGNLCTSARNLLVILLLFYFSLAFFVFYFSNLLVHFQSSQALKSPTNEVTSLLRTNSAEFSRSLQMPTEVCNDMRVTS